MFNPQHPVVQHPEMAKSKDHTMLQKPEPTPVLCWGSIISPGSCIAFSPAASAASPEIFQGLSGLLRGGKTCSDGTQSPTKLH